MKNGRFLLNPFQMLNPSFNVEMLGIETWYETPCSTPGSMQEGVLAMISKLIGITKELSQCVRTCRTSTFDMCENLANDVNKQEQVLTRLVESSSVSHDIRKGLICFPCCLQESADMMQRILDCCRIKARSGIRFSYTAYAELDELFAAVLEMMSNLRAVFRKPHSLLLEAIISDGKRLERKLEEARKAHLRRLKASVCAVGASSMYKDILNSLKSVNECLIKMSSALLKLGQGVSVPQDYGEAAKSPAGETYCQG